MYAQDSFGGKLQACRVTSEKVKSNNKGRGSKGSFEVMGYWNYLPNF